MYAVQQTTIVSGLAAWHLTGDDALVEVVPSRGGLVTRFRVGGDELLFLDESTLVDLSKNVRGGIPVLFPFGGKLPGDAWTDTDGRSFAMKQHGFARNLPFEVVGSETGLHEARLSLRLVATDATRAVFPREFELNLDFILQRATLRIEITIVNHDARPLPHAIGFHPYLRVPDASKDHASVETDATLGWDNRKAQPLAVGTPDFTLDELDWHLHDHTLPGTLLRRPPLRPIRFEWFDGFEALVLWTLKGRDFVCVEPWVAPAGAFPAGEGVRSVAPGAVDKLSFSISV